MHYIDALREHQSGFESIKRHELYLNIQKMKLSTLGILSAEASFQFDASFLAP